jgi:translation initiation factor IF-3
MIRAKEIRVIDDEKKLIGILSVPEALAVARERGLDLVEIAPTAAPPVCRVMDYGKFLYELHKKEHEAKKHQKQVLVKEIKLRPKISIHDYTFKTKHILRFLEEGNKVKVTVMLRGREKSRPDLGIQVLERVKETVKDFGRQDGDVRRQDWAVSALIIPTKTGGRDAKAKNPQGSPQEVQGNGEKKDTPVEGV